MYLYSTKLFLSFWNAWLVRREGLVLIFFVWEGSPAIQREGSPAIVRGGVRPNGPFVQIQACTFTYHYPTKALEGETTLCALYWYISAYQ